MTLRLRRLLLLRLLLVIKWRQVSTQITSRYIVHDFDGVRRRRREILPP
jgi:hypothetical protein